MGLVLLVVVGVVGVVVVVVVARSVMREYMRLGTRTQKTQAAEG